MHICSTRGDELEYEAWDVFTPEMDHRARFYIKLMYEFCFRDASDTYLQQNPWWAVDLSKPVELAGFLLYNRGGSFSMFRLNPCRADIILCNIRLYSAFQ